MRMAFYTLGCKVNQYETQVLTRLFAAQGYDVEPPGPGCDVYVVNSCTVTAEGDRKTCQLLRRLRRENPGSILVLTGCFPQAFPQRASALEEADVVTGSANRGSLPQALARRLSTGERVVEITPHVRDEKFESMEVEAFGGRTRAFLKIEDGCENYCAYCIIPTARGPVRSKPMEEIREEVAALAAAGHREVVLAGINLSAYGREWGGRLVDAVELAAAHPGIHRVRLGSLEPDIITPEDFSRMAATGKVCPQFHLSLQNGSDAVLERMGRKYRTADYLRVVETIRERFSRPALTTDLMVGFPGETEEEFRQSVEFAQKVGFARIHVFSYSPRAGTRAAVMPDQVPQQVKHQRSAALIAAAGELRKSFLEAMVGSVEPVLFEERGKDGFQTGYTPNYTPVSVPETEDLRGRICNVRITGLRGDGCVGVPEPDTSRDLKGGIL